MKQQDDDQKHVPTVEELQKQLEEAVAQNEEWKQKYLRALADYQNIVKFSREQIAETRRYAAEEVIHSLLVIIDTLEKAQEHLKDMGLGLAIKGFEAILAQYNVKKIDVKGKQFDPTQMECVDVVENDKDNIVVEELRSGYMIGDKILRVAQVKVGRTRKNAE